MSCTRRKRSCSLDDCSCRSSQFRATAWRPQQPQSRVERVIIGEITRRLNAEGVSTRKATACWERSTVCAMLRNPAYRSVACLGKTRASATDACYAKTASAGCNYAQLDTRTLSVRRRSSPGRAVLMLSPRKFVRDASP
jgi:hypothetical protein